MRDDILPAPHVQPPLQRARGRAVVGLLPPAGGRMRLGTLHQSGAAKVFLPRVHEVVPEVVFLNTAGGLTGGDVLGYELDLAPGTAAVATTQTAERAYSALPGLQARLDVTLRLGAGACADWLPQETIVYDGASLSRGTRADLGQGARLVMAEMLVLGRAAMGETVARLALRDRREIWRCGQPVLVDPFALDESSLGSRPALLGGARAVAMVALVADGAQEAAGPVRQALAELSRADGAPGGVEAAVSGWDGRCVVRLRGADALALKRAVVRVLAILRGGAGLPRVWQI